MTKKKTYAEKLKDPRWQKKRLEILDRDNFTCQYCGDKDITLHVHHYYYHQSGNPWDVDHTGLVTLCEDCHHLTEKGSPKIIKDILLVLQCAPETEDTGCGTISHFYKRWIIEVMLNYHPKREY